MKPEKNPNAVAMGKIGGTNRWKKIGKKKRSEIMKEIALKRWAKKDAK